MSGADSNMSRRLARGIVRHAARILRPVRPVWSEAMEREFEHIDSNHGAVIWAVGCVWASYLERLKTKALSIVSTAVLFWMLSALIPISGCFWIWYLISLGYLAGFQGRDLWLLDVSIAVVLLTLIVVGTPGRWQWRLLSASLFPYMAFLCLPVAGLVQQFNNFTGLLELDSLYFSLRLLLLGLNFGVVVAALLTLPFTLLYRARAASLATLGLLPVFAIFIRGLADTAKVNDSSMRLTLRMVSCIWPIICTIVFLVIFTSICNKWLPRWSARDVAQQ